MPVVTEPQWILDDVMPAYDVRDAHSIWIPSSVGAAYTAVRTVTAAEVPLFTPLMAVRVLPALLLGRPLSFDLRRPILVNAERNGFVPLGEQAGSELALGAVGRFWSLTGNRLVQLADRAAFETFEEPGYAKAVMGFRVVPEGAGCRVITETRVVGTDDEARRRFALYWRAISAGSAAIRWSWLRAIRSRATRAPAPTSRAATVCGP